jgi:hypothetical protein
VNPTIAYRIGFLIGAEWDEQSKQWMRFPRSGRIPFTYEFFREFRRERLGKPADWMNHEAVLESQMARIFTLVDDARWWEWRFKCGKFLEESWFEFGIEENFQARLRRKGQGGEPRPGH